MCGAFQGQVTALPRTPAALSSNNRLVASLAMLQGGPRAWGWVIAALEPHSSALRLYDHGEATELTARPADFGSPTPQCPEQRQEHGAVPLGDCGGVGGGPVLQAVSGRCLPPGHGGEHGTMGPGVLHLPVENQGRPGEVCRCVAPLGGAAVSRGGNAARGAATKHVASPASRPCRRCRKGGPKSGAEATPQEGPPQTVWQLLQHQDSAAAPGGELATEQCGSGEVNVCPWSHLEGASHCTWRAGKHLRPSRLHPKDLLDHLAKDHGSDPAQRDQAEAMIKGVIPGVPVGPFAVAKAGSRALALPAGVQPSGTQEASSSATSSGARSSVAVSSTGSTEEGTGAARSGATRTSAFLCGARPAGIFSWGARQRSGSGRAAGLSRPPPPTGGGGPPPSGGPDPADDPGPAMML